MGDPWRVPASLCAMSETADVLVAGLGGCGASTLYHLARRGVRAIGIDRFDPGHDRGSSHGETRLIRLAYCEHPDYVPLLYRAFELWEAWQAASDAELYLPELPQLLHHDLNALASIVRSWASDHALPQHGQAVFLLTLSSRLASLCPQPP